jgi:hypothetical protein
MMGIQLGDANGYHTPYYDEPDEAAHGKVCVPHGDIVGPGRGKRVATHAQ